MPVKKNPMEEDWARNLPAPEKKKECCKISDCCSDFGHKIFAVLLAIILVYVIVLLGTIIRNNFKKFNYIGKAEVGERTVSLQGEGKVNARPDVAVTVMGMVTEAKTVSEAQKKNDDIIGKLNGKLKELKLDEKDIQTTSYNIYPMYRYSESEGNVLTGYQVNQNVTIKIRDLTKANQILSLAGELGINNVSGLNFTIDDPEKYQDEARMQALEKIARKVQFLSQNLGVSVGNVVSYDENDVSTPSPTAYKEMLVGAGGSAIETGSTEVVKRINMVFEIKQ